METSYENPWLYQGEIFTSANIRDWFGFVYLLTHHPTGKKYIGRKYFWSLTKKPGKRIRTRKESNWKAYYGSCNPLREDVERIGKSLFKREILSLHLTKGQVNYNEIKQQFINDVLEATDNQGNRLFYNDNILSRYFTPRDPHREKTPEHKEKISASLKGRKPQSCELPKTTVHKQKISESLRETSHFVNSNPNDPLNFTYRVKTENGIIDVVNLGAVMVEQGWTLSDLNLLRVWSKKQPVRTYTGKVKKVDLHRKYRMRILSITNTHKNTVAVFAHE